jgi:hypothetical protein
VRQWIRPLLDGSSITAERGRRPHFQARLSTTSSRGYARSAQRLSSCIDILLEAGGATKYVAPAVLRLLRGRLDGLAELSDANPALVNERFADHVVFRGMTRRIDAGRLARLLSLRGGNAAAERSLGRIMPTTMAKA